MPTDTKTCQNPVQRTSDRSTEQRFVVSFSPTWLSHSVLCAFKTHSARSMYGRYSKSFIGTKCCVVCTEKCNIHATRIYIHTMNAGPVSWSRLEPVSGVLATQEPGWFALGAVISAGLDRQFSAVCGGTWRYKPGYQCVCRLVVVSINTHHASSA